MDTNELFNENETTFTPDTRTLDEIQPDDTEPSEDWLADDLDNYHRAIGEWLDNLLDFYYQARIPALRTILAVAEADGFTASFHFQDETRAHFNHDVALECARRLA